MGASDMDAGTLLFGLAFLVIYVIAWWKIFDKAGWAGWVALLMALPLFNAIVFLVFAFSKWPVTAREGPPEDVVDVDVELPYEGLPLTPRGKPLGHDDSWP